MKMVVIYQTVFSDKFLQMWNSLLKLYDICACLTWGRVSCRPLFKQIMNQITKTYMCGHASLNHTKPDPSPFILLIHSQVKRVFWIVDYILASVIPYIFNEHIISIVSLGTPCNIQRQSLENWYLRNTICPQVTGNYLSMDIMAIEWIYYCYHYYYYYYFLISSGIFSTPWYVHIFHSNFTNLTSQGFAYPIATIPHNKKKCYHQSTPVDRTFYELHTVTLY